MNPEPEARPQRRGKKGRLLIFIVAYNAENTIESVLRRIPVELSDHYEVEVLIIDDSSQDETFARSEIARRSGVVPFTTTVFFNPVNQGYGGNQKIGFHYALKNSFDWVALVHGDGQYAPECLPDLVRPLANGEADAVFGSRMMQGRAALKGGMPLYKFVGNKILTRFQNMLLDSKLSEFHSGYRLYAVSALAKIPFDLNSNDFHFDTEIIIQLLTAGLKIKELPIPTFYGEEICHVNGLGYAWHVCCATMQARVQKYHIFYDPKFDCLPEDAALQASCEPHSAEWMVLETLRRPVRVHIFGTASSEFADALEARGHRVTHEPEGLLHTSLTDCSDIDCLLMLEDYDLSRHPDQYVRTLRNLCRLHRHVRIFVAAGNIGFCLTRMMLLLGRFSYTRRGIISLGHARFFTLRSLKKLFVQNWFECNEVVGLPIQYTRVFNSTAVASICSLLHRGLIKVRPTFFSYQLLLTVSPKPSLDYLLERASRFSEEKSKTMNRQ